MNIPGTIFIEPIPEDLETLSKRDKFYTEMQAKALREGGKGTIGEPCQTSPIAAKREKVILEAIGKHGTRAENLPGSKWCFTSEEVERIVQEVLLRSGTNDSL